MWFDGDTTLQQFPDHFEFLLNSQGWETHAKYRALSGSDAKRNFADVRLFRSVGTDGEIRNFGAVHAYGYTAALTANAQEFISQNSLLGFVTVSDGIKNDVPVLVFPIEPGSVYLYHDGQLVSDTTYTVDPMTGKIHYTGAVPVSGVKVTASYTPSPLAPLPVRRMFFFTFEDVRGEKLVVRGQPGSILPDGDGAKKTFPIPTTSTIKPATLAIFVNQIEVVSTNYTFDSITNSITFTVDYVAPPAGAEVNAEYTLQLSSSISGSTTNFGDIVAEGFDPSTPADVMKVVYEGLNYLYPSLPTAMSFTPLANFNRGWQRDSTIYYWGNITKDRIVMYFRPDPSAGPENAFFTPLYIGRLTTIGRAPRKNMVIISGCRPEDEIKWASNKKIGPYFVDYGPNTSNGNSSVQLQQSVGGTYYQTHVLAFITHDKQMDSGEARFNPSVYSGKYHIGPMFVVHPNDGYVGKLDEVYAIHPKNIYQMDELEVDETTTDLDIGTGDGVKKVFHLDHAPTGTTLAIKVDCTILPAVDPVDNTKINWVLSKENKTVTFTIAPATGLQLIASYSYKQVYRYTLADTPITPFLLGAISPYAPIGLGILKENL